MRTITQQAIVDGITNTLIIEEDGDMFYFVSLNGMPIDELPLELEGVAWETI